MTWTSVIGTSLGYILYSFVFISTFLVYCAQVLTSPLLQFGSYLLHIALFPYRVLEKFQNICTFFGSAVVIGLATGLILYFTSRFIFQLLQLSPETSARRHPLIRRRQKGKAKEITGVRPWITQHHWKPDSSNYQDKGLGSGSQSSAVKASSSRGREAEGYYTTWKDERKGEPEGGLLSTMILEEDNSSSDRGGT